VSKRTSHGGTGFIAPHTKWLSIKFQFLQTKHTEGRCLYIFVKKDQHFNKIDISHHCIEQDSKICAVKLETKHVT
jgi:hypothetical protein